MTRDFPVNIDVAIITGGNPQVKTFTWNSDSKTELSLLLNAAAELEDDGWAVGLECPIKGVQRSYRIPVFAVRDGVGVLLKPTMDAKKVNVSGLKMLDIKAEVEKVMTGLVVRAIVLLHAPHFDERRRSNDEYEVWLKGNKCPI